MRLKDRQKQRRHYLWQKAENIGLGTGSGIVCIVSALITILIFGLGVFVCSMTDIDDNGNLVNGVMPFGVVMLFVSLVTGIFAFLSGFYARKKIVTAARLPRVPAVNFATLPAEEVLLRGSQEPTLVHSEVLLRPCGKSVDVPQEELLRAAILEE